MKKLFYAAAASAALFAMAPAANAAHTIETNTTVTPTGQTSISATFEHEGIPAGTFSDVFTFTTPAGTITSAVMTIAVVLNGTADLDFSRVFLTTSAGTVFDFANVTGTGVFELRLLPDTIIPAGTQSITVNGVSRGNGSFSGTLAFLSTAGAVPEPATWAMMLFGFGAVGYSMRRRPTVRFAQAI